MAKNKRRTCSICGITHMRSIGVCHKCERKLKAAIYYESPAYCSACGGVIDYKYSKKRRGYCSLVCSRVVNAARQMRVSAVVHAAIKRDELAHPRKLKCVDCGKDANGYEHRKYTRPLDVEPTCRSCNSRRGRADDIPEFIAETLGVAVEQVKSVLDKTREIRESQIWPDIDDVIDIAMRAAAATKVGAGEAAPEPEREAA